MKEISSATKKFIKEYQSFFKSLQTKEKVATIHVDEVVSRVASFYEKIRGVVEWKEEHLLRKAAIERILKRRLFLQTKSQEIAESFVLELIRGGYFPNDQIEEERIEDVKKILDKYLFITKNAHHFEEKPKIQLYNWLLEICACEIEECLSRSFQERILIDYMSEVMSERIEINESKLIQKVFPKEEKEIQIFIATQKALFKFDQSTIRYYLLRKYYKWENITKEQLLEVSQNIYKIWSDLESKLNHPYAEKFYKICEKYDTCYLIISDIINEDPLKAENNFSQPEKLELLIRKAYEIRLKKLKGRMAKAAIFSTISIFLTKILLAFAIEIPFDKYFLGEFNKQSLIFNIVVPPLLMFFLVLTIKPPHKENLEKLILEIMKIVYQNEKKETYLIKIPKKKGLILNFIIFIFYSLSFVVSFGLIIYGLRKLNFGILSIIIFLMFFSLISFAGVKIRERAKELDIIERKGTVLNFLIDIFSLPFLQVGKWLSNQWSKFNIIVVLINILIDTPFHIFVEILEQWRFFLKEKKEEIH